MDVSFIIVQVLSGLTMATVLFLVASGLTLIFGVVGLFNFAHGSFYMLGAYFAYQFISLMNINFWMGVFLVMVSTGICGWIMEYFFVRRIYGRHEEGAYQILLTYTFILILDDLVKIIWGTDYKSISRPTILTGTIPIGNWAIPSYSIFIIVLGMLIAGGMWLLLQKSRFGRIIRAISSDRSMVNAMGINVKRFLTIVFAFATALGGLSGALAAPLRTVTPGAGVEIIIEALIVVVIGGLGNFWGAWIGALIIGQVTAFGILWLPRWSILFIYMVMAGVLIIRPEGLLGEASK
jgi:branched-chain amino acid transport system permease protein